MEQPITELYKKQISLSEWFQAIGHERAEALRQEDTVKRDRLSVLNQHIGLPFDKPVRFPARQVADQDEVFKKYLAEHGQELCAMRLLPQDWSLPKLRMRGHTVRDVTCDWFPAQLVDPDKYRVEFVPHSETYYWSTIFVVNRHAIFGEIIADTHAQLTQGFYTEVKPIVFFYDFENWQLTPSNGEAQEHLEELIRYLYVPDDSGRAKLREELGAAFVRNYLQGYFETVKCEIGTWFVDYNQSLGEMYSNYRPHERTSPGEGELAGAVGAPGVARGRVRIVSDPTGVSLQAGDVLVCDMTSPDYVHLMQQATAIVTNRGGILCHAAIIARELGKPCIVGTGEAMKVLHNGDQVEVNADLGVIKRLAPSNDGVDANKGIVRRLEVVEKNGKM